MDSSASTFRADQGQLALQRLLGHKIEGAERRRGIEIDDAIEIAGKIAELAEQRCMLYPDLFIWSSDRGPAVAVMTSVRFFPSTA